MAEKKETKTNKRRTQVKDLPKDEKELGKDELKKVKGGNQPHSGVANMFSKM